MREYDYRYPHEEHIEVKGGVLFIWPYSDEFASEDRALVGDQWLWSFIAIDTDMIAEPRAKFAQSREDAIKQSKRALRVAYKAIGQR